MKIRVLILLLFIVWIRSYSQVNEELLNFSEEFSKKKIKPIKPTVSYWNFPSKITFGLSANTFKDWNAGGVNNFTIHTGLEIFAIYKKGGWVFENKANFVYGAMWEKQEDTLLRTFNKFDDKLELNSSLGYVSFFSDNLYFNSNFNFKTQIAKGYPNKNKKALYSSDIFAPAYLSFSILGLQYNNNKNDNNYFALFLTPISSKYTLVLDDTLSKLGAFGVEKGKHSRGELGFFLENNFKYEVYKNIFLRNRLILFGNFVKDLGNIDINWDMEINAVVNKYINFTFLIETIYDNDIKRTDKLLDGTSKEIGPAFQIKQKIAVNITYSF